MHKLRVCAFFFFHDTFNLGEDYEVSRINKRSRRCWKTKLSEQKNFYRDVLNEVQMI